MPPHAERLHWPTVKDSPEGRGQVFPKGILRRPQAGGRVVLFGER